MTKPKCLHEPCEPEGALFRYCDVCNPIPRFEVIEERVQRLFYERTIKATTEAEALAIFAQGTAWPSSYDERGGEVLERHEPSVKQLPFLCPECSMPLDGDCEPFE